MMPRSPVYRVPWLLKVAFTAFMAVLVPVYLHEYGPTNFLYFCDVALLMTLVALWKEDPLWASMPAVGILLPQAFWILDFLAGLVGTSRLGMTDYMFDNTITVFARALSFFHFWLPLLLLWLVWRLGYDRRALPAWTAIAWGLLITCYLFTPIPPAPESNPKIPVNINYAYGISDAKPQEFLSQNLFFLLLMCGLPVFVYAPTHLLLARLFPKKSSSLVNGI